MKIVHESETISKNGVNHQIRPTNCRSIFLDPFCLRYRIFIAIQFNCLYRNIPGYRIYSTLCLTTFINQNCLINSVRDSVLIFWMSYWQEMDVNYPLTILCSLCPIFLHMKEENILQGNLNKDQSLHLSRIKWVSYHRLCKLWFKHLTFTVDFK